MAASQSKASAPTSRQVISGQLRMMIQARGMTAYALGQQAGVDPGMIQRFLNQERDIRLDTLDRLADVLGLRLVEGARGRGRPTRSDRATTPARAVRPSPPPSPAIVAQDADESAPQSEADIIEQFASIEPTPDEPTGRVYG